MALQIVNPAVVRKVEHLAKVTGLSQAEAIERAVDMMLRDTESRPDPARQMGELLAQLDRLPDRADAFDSPAWDARGLPA